MRVIICALGSSGDVYPCIEIGSILKERGYDVYVLANEYFRRNIESRNVSYLKVGSKDDFIKSVQDNRLWKKKTSLFSLSEYMAEQQEEMYSSIESLVVDNCIVIHSLWVFSAKVICDKYSLKRFPISLTNSNLKLYPGNLINFLESKLSIPLNWKVELFKRYFASSSLQEIISWIRKKNNLPINPNIYTDWVDMKSQSIILYEQWFYEKKPLHGFYMGFLFNKSKKSSYDHVIKSFVDKKTAVFFTSWALIDDVFIKSLLGCLEREGLKCVLVTPTADNIYIEGNVIKIPHINIELIKGCLFAIHHGGIGTTAQLLRSGIPQLIYPKAFDQFENAKSLVRINCGIKGHSLMDLKNIIKMAMENDNDCAIYSSFFSEDTKSKIDALEFFLRS